MNAREGVGRDRCEIRRGPYADRERNPRCNGEIGHEGACWFDPVDERIVAAAIRFDGVVHTGIRHDLIIEAIVRTTGAKPHGGVQGFVTSANRFLTRAEAEPIALAMGQVQREACGSLMSEELWDTSAPRSQAVYATQPAPESVEPAGEKEQQSPFWCAPCVGEAGVPGVPRYGDPKRGKCGRCGMRRALWYVGTVREPAPPPSETETPRCMVGYQGPDINPGCGNPLPCTEHPEPVAVEPAEHCERTWNTYQKPARVLWCNKPRGHGDAHRWQEPKPEPPSAALITDHDFWPDRYGYCGVDFMRGAEIIRCGMRAASHARRG